LIPKLLGPQGSSGGKRFTVNLPEVKGRLLSAVDEADRSRHHQAGLSLVFFQTLFKISSHLALYNNIFINMNMQGMNMGMQVQGLGKMRIDVIEAKLTRDVEFFGTMAPFCKVALCA
jgi:hypothetical protein